jgi:hypothetical protein
MKLILGRYSPIGLGRMWWSMVMMSIKDGDCHDEST